MAEKRQQSGPLKAVSTLRPGDRSEDLYDEWSGDYDEDLAREWGYIAPRLAADGLEAVCPERDSRLIDLGCGTGLVGAELSSRGYSEIDGLDVSTGMLDRARAKGIYRNLTKADLTARTSLPDSAYDAAICVGSMGAGHVDARHLPELLRIVKPGGYLVIYMSGQHYLDEGFEEKFRAHETAGLWAIETIEASNYMEALERPGRLVIGRKPQGES